jgi:xylulokinase
MSRLASSRAPVPVLPGGSEAGRNEACPLREQEEKQEMLRMHENACLIGVDVGTTNVKAGAFTLGGRALAIASAELQVNRPRPGWASYNPIDLWRQTVRVLVEVSRSIAGRFEPEAIAVSSMAETAIPIDACGLPVYQAIAWFDSRTTEQAEWWVNNFGSEFIFARTGLPVLPIFGINKLCWIKQHEPEIFSRIARWLSVSDYINYCLCSVEAAELSLASRVMALDLRTRRWSEEILDAAGISPLILGEPVPSGQVLGQISAGAARITELPLRVRVVTGGHDHPCAALGSGVSETGLVLDSLGTSESLLVVLDSPMLESKAAHLGFAQGCHVLRDRYLCFGGLVTAGAAIDWARAIFFQEMVREDAYRHFEEIAAQSMPGSGGVYFMPSLRAASPPHSDAYSRGVFIGLSSDTSLADLARSVLEGLAYAAYDSLRALRSVFRVEITQIRAVGGPARNRLLMKMKAALANLPFSVVEIEEASCRGAAILAGLGVGIYESIQEIHRHVEFRETVIEAPAGWTQMYHEGYETVYRHIYPSVRDLHQRIARSS